MLNLIQVEVDIATYSILEQVENTLISLIHAGVEGSEQSGALWHYNYDPETYHTRTYGTEEQKKQWREQGEKLRQSICADERLKLEDVRQQKKSIEDRYSKILDDISFNGYESPGFCDFLTVIARTLKET